MKKDSTKKIVIRFENDLVEVLKERLDQDTKITYGSGSGLNKQDVIIPNFGIEIEAKNQMTVKLIDWWEQCKRQEFGNMGVLALRNPRKAEFQETLIVMSLDDFIQLVKNQAEEEVVVQSNFSPKLKYKIANLKRAIQEVVRELE